MLGFMACRAWLSTYFQFTKPIRKIIYTTNAIEGFHRQIRKVTKTKGSFPNDEALLKLIYLATRNIMKKWTSPIHNWAITVKQLSIIFDGRLKLEIQWSSHQRWWRDSTDRVQFTLPFRKLITYYINCPTRNLFRTIGMKARFKII